MKCVVPAVGSSGQGNEWVTSQPVPWWSEPERGLRIMGPTSQMSRGRDWCKGHDVYIQKLQSTRLQSVITCADGEVIFLLFKDSRSSSDWFEGNCFMTLSQAVIDRRCGLVGRSLQGRKLLHWAQPFIRNTSGKSRTRPWVSLPWSLVYISNSQCSWLHNAAASF